MTDTTPQAQLYAAMARASASISSVSKSGRNDYHKYDYATEADIVREVRTALATEGICWLPSVVSASAEEVPGSKRGERITTVELEIAWCHSGGGVHLSRWRGQGADSSDKGYYKAYTGAIKYALLKTFLIPTGDDPEDDAPQRARPPQRTSDISYLAQEMIMRIDAAIEGTHYQDKAKRKELLGKLFAALGTTGQTVDDTHWQRLKIALPAAKGEAARMLIAIAKGEEVAL